ncbi:MAG: leucine-rich repeat domain-containing protein [Eubacteriales bacterium]
MPPPLNKPQENNLFEIEDDVLIAVLDQTLETYKIPEGVTEIEKDAFTDCSALKRIEFCATEKPKIATNAFTNTPCEEEAQRRDAPESALSIYNGCLTSFADDNYTHVVIPSTVTEIACGVFESCDGLISVTVPSSVTSVGDKAFAYSTSLRDISLPSSVKELGEEVFRIWSKNLKQRNVSRKCKLY